MRPHQTPLRLTHYVWLILLGALLAMRLPSVVEPAGNDQSLYMYVADRVLEGGAPYVDAWDQKPPAVFFVYAAIRAVWPHAGAVAVADLIAAVLIAWLLAAIGRRTLGTTGGYAAAAVFLLFGNPSIARLSGVYIRGQCEIFIALAVTVAMACVWRDRPRPSHVFLAGLSLGAAFWLKYNALAYLLPVMVALLWAGNEGSGFSLRSLWRRSSLWKDAAWIAAGMAAISVPVLAYLYAHDALGALRLATIDYNLRYSAETYQGGGPGAAWYLFSMPFGRARADMLWFLGGLGVILLAVAGGQGKGRTLSVSLAWLAAAIISIAVNGARDLPQYFVQANPVLAFVAAAGIVDAIRSGRTWRLAAMAAIVLGMWKVGLDAPSVGGFRLGGLPQLVDNVTFDLRYIRGGISRTDYLARFKGAQKYDAADVDEVSRYVQATTRPDDKIMVFGFAPAVYLESGRLSASRFFWSRPVVLEFAADTPGYGSRGLLEDLETTRPALVILQKQDWGVDGESMEFFLATPHLRDWLMAGYTFDRDTPLFGIWRRRS